MDRKGLLKRFVIENSSIFLSSTYNKEVAKEAKRKYFIDRFKNKFGSPSNNEIAEAIIEGFINIQKITNMNELNSFVSKYPFLKDNLRNLAKFEYAFSKIKPPVTRDDIKKLKVQTHYELEREKIKEEVIVEEFVKIAWGEGDGKVWFASHKEADAEEYLYAPAKGYVYMNTTLGVVHTDKSYMWFLSSVYVEAVLEVWEYDESLKFIKTHRDVVWSKNYDGYWTDVPISGHIEIDWQQNHRYISKIVFHAHSESDTLPVFPSLSGGHAFIGGWAQNMVWYVS